ncbi:RDD family protein [Sulfuricystis multivorans]|uniref:RDD family protein n=1 Tax=Sulfuricystis multivorans TaxID=2211108 RepID=UPI001559F432|nr:RDD family protein [Sulfuricystis multivorans]
MNTASPSPFALASLRRRLASLFYETLLLAGALLVAFLLPQIILGMAFGIVAPGLFLIAHLVLVVATYFLWQWRHGGQTLAMKTWRLRLVGIDGAAPSLGQLLLRQILSWPSVLFYGAGLLWAFFDRDRQFLHDRLAGTRIIFVPPTTAAPPPPAGT